MTLESLQCTVVDAGAQIDNDKAPQVTPTWPTHDQTLAGSTQATDHFITRNGVEFAGTHILLDLWGAKRLDDLELMEKTLLEAIEAAGATLLHIHLHHFTPNEGISGVAVLAESHISVHTWPERNFAAFDVFMCGDAQPEAAIPVLRNAFSPETINVSEHLRGAHIENIEPANDQPDETL